MSDSRYQRTLRERWAAAPESDPPSPWKRANNGVAGGVYAVGLDESGAFLLSISGAGRYVLDCKTGDTLERVPDDDSGSWLDTSRLLAEGVGPLGGAMVRVAGSFIGGGLATTTSDGWGVGRAAPAWPNEVVWVEEPDKPGFYENGTFHKVWDWDAPFAYGFSASGTTLVVACSNEIKIWTREG